MSEWMADFADWLIPEEFMPHGHCYLWDPFLLRQNVISNALVGIAYYCIPIALMYLVKKRKDLEFDWIFIMFSAFIFACGTTHFINIITIWRPAYHIDAGLMSVTAALSIATLIMLVKLMPKLLTIPSPSVLKRTIDELKDQVSLRLEAEAKLKNLNSKLDLKVSQRTSELTKVNQELAEAKSVLEDNLEEITKVNHELGNFAYAASHDLKSPLRGIDQLASWIEEDIGENLSADTQNHLSMMRNRIGRMEMLLDDLLAYSRAGSYESEFTEINTHTLIEEIFDLASGKNNVDLVLDDNLPTITTKKAPLALVFRNLIGNAIKHHDKPHGTISISSKEIEGVLEFTVQDDGPGIAPEHHERVFAMFQTLRTRDEVEGSGMGLALVKKTIESVEGIISLESDGVRGCLFRFTWPLQK